MTRLERFFRTFPPFSESGPTHGQPTLNSGSLQPLDQLVEDRVDVENQPDPDASSNDRSRTSTDGRFTARPDCLHNVQQTHRSDEEQDHDNDRESPSDHRERGVVGREVEVRFDVGDSGQS